MILARLSSPYGIKCLGRGEDIAFGILLQPSGGFLHALKYRLAKLWDPEFHLKGERVPGHTLLTLPPALLHQGQCPIQMSFERAKEI